MVKAFTKDAAGKMAIISIEPKSVGDDVNLRITAGNEMFQKLKRAWGIGDVKMLDSGTTTIAGEDAVLSVSARPPGDAQFAVTVVDVELLTDSSDTP